MINSNSPNKDALSDAQTTADAQKLEETFRNQTYQRTDRLFAGLMAFQWIAGIFAAAVISPRTWIGGQYETHFHVWVSVLLGGAISFLPIVFALMRPGKPLTRHVIACGQMLMSALLIHLLGGRIETHFHIFGSLAFLAFYRDWKVLITATVVVAVDHFWRGIYWPQSVFGELNAAWWRWLEHAAWVVFEDIFLVFACLQGVREMRDRAYRETQLTSLSRIRAKETEATAAQESRVRAILDSTADAIITIGEDGLIRSVNAATGRMFGYTEQEMLGQDVQRLSKSLGGEINGSGLGEFRSEENHTTGEEQEFRGQRKDGATFPATVRVTKTFYDNDPLYIATIQDVTLREQAERERSELFDAIRETAHHLSASSAEISAIMRQETQGAERDASTVSHTVSIVQQAARTAEESKHLAEDVAETARQADDVSKSGRTAIEETRVSMNQVHKHAESTRASIVMLAEKAENIAEIIKAVEDVAEQTNILGLNAAVEASRAGEAGQGFAVVAREVKSLAAQAKHATEQVRNLLREILEATQNAVSSTKQGADSVGKAGAVVAKAETTIDELVTMVSEAARVAARIVSASNQQASSMSEVVASMDEMDQTAKKSLVATKETEGAAADLNSLGTRLKGLVDRGETARQVAAL